MRVVARSLCVQVRETGALDIHCGASLLRSHKLGHGRPQPLHLQRCGAGTYICGCRHALFVMARKAFGYGGKLVRDGDIDGGRVIRVLFAVIMGAMGLGQVGLSCVCLWIHISLR